MNKQPASAFRDPAEFARHLHECRAIGDLWWRPEDHPQMSGGKRVPETLINAGHRYRRSTQDEIDQLEASHVLVARQSCALLLQNVAQGSDCAVGPARQ